MTLVLGLDTCRRTGYGSTSRRKAVRAAQDKLLMLGTPQRRTITEKINV